MNARPLKVLGAESTQRRLFNYLLSGRVHPALLFAGGNPEVKLAVALSIAKYHLCSERGEEAFCGKCSSCRRIEKGLHPDVVVYGRTDEEEGEENK